MTDCSYLMQLCTLNGGTCVLYNNQECIQCDAELSLEELRDEEEAYYTQIEREESA